MVVHATRDRAHKIIKMICPAMSEVAKKVNGLIEANICLAIVENLDSRAIAFAGIFKKLWKLNKVLVLRSWPDVPCSTPACLAEQNFLVPR